MNFLRQFLPILEDIFGNNFAIFPLFLKSMLNFVENKSLNISK